MTPTSLALRAARACASSTWSWLGNACRPGPSPGPPGSPTAAGTAETLRASATSVATASLLRRTARTSRLPVAPLPFGRGARHVTVPPSGAAGRGPPSAATDSHPDACLANEATSETLVLTSHKGNSFTNKNFGNTACSLDKLHRCNLRPFGVGGGREEAARRLRPGVSAKKLVPPHWEVGAGPGLISSHWEAGT